MEVADAAPAAAAAAPPAAAEAGAPDAAPDTASVRDMTLKDIISGMKKRRGAKPMPSAVKRAAERRKRRRLEAAGLPVDDAPAQHTTHVTPPPPPPPPEEADAADASDEQESEVVAPQVTLDENGNIVIDQASLVVSAGTATNAELDRGDVTTIENHAYSSHITSATYAKRESATKWEGGETERFYAALRKFGTDFSLMESSFPNRSRRQLKLKFKREEKEFPERIDQALNGPPLPLPPVEERVPVGRDAEQEREGEVVSGAVVVEEADEQRAAGDDEDAGEDGAGREEEAGGEEPEDDDGWSDSDDSSAE